MPRAETLSSDYSATQRKSVMLMMSIGKFCELFGLRDREESTVVLFDESWIFNSSKNGRALSNPCAELVEVLTIPLLLSLNQSKIQPKMMIQETLDEFLLTMTKMNEKIFFVIFTFVIAISVKDFFEKGISKALIRFGIFTLIYVGSMTFFADGANKVQEVNTLSQNVQGQLVDLTSGSLTKNTGNISESLLVSNRQLDGTSNIRNLISSKQKKICSKKCPLVLVLVLLLLALYFLMLVRNHWHLF